MPSSNRFLNPPENTESHETTSFLDELDESDVVWSSSHDSILESYPTTPLSTSFSSTSPRQFLAPTSGLSAAIGFSDSHSRSPVLQRKKTVVSPLLSAAPPSPITSPISRSAPVKVPIWMGKAGRGRYDRRTVMEGFDEEEADNDEEPSESDDGIMVPPHEIVARSHRTTTFSVFEGVGRTLKGRDLTRVRNTVMHKTGFLE